MFSETFLFSSNFLYLLTLKEEFSLQVPLGINISDRLTDHISFCIFLPLKNWSANEKF